MTGNDDAPPPGWGSGASIGCSGYWLGMDPEVVAPASIEW